MASYDVNLVKKLPAEILERIFRFLPPSKLKVVVQVLWEYVGTSLLSFSWGNNTWVICFGFRDFSQKTTTMAKLRPFGAESGLFWDQFWTFLGHNSRCFHENAKNAIWDPIGTPFFWLLCTAGGFLNVPMYHLKGEMER